MRFTTVESPIAISSPLRVNAHYAMDIAHRALYHLASAKSTDVAAFIPRERFGCEEMIQRCSRGAGPVESRTTSSGLMTISLPSMERPDSSGTRLVKTVWPIRSLGM